MEWSDYYLSLEKWVDDQYKHIGNVQKYLINSLRQRENFENANYLARKKFEREMQSLKANKSRNADSQNTTVESASEPVVNRFRRYVIPHPWRRVAAEFIDIFIMVLIKSSLIYLISEFAKYLGFNLPGAPEYRTFRRAHGWAKSEIVKSGFPMTRLERLLFVAQTGARDDLVDFDLLLIADQLGRFVSATLEAILISHAFLGSGPGGATLGKWIMNLKVVSCEEVIPLPEFVEVVPGTDIGFCRALVRSMLKGTSLLTFFSFLCMMLFQYHRCTYDIIAGTLVVQPLSRSDQDDHADQQQQQNQPAEH